MRTRTTGALGLGLSLVLVVLVAAFSLASGGVTYHPVMANGQSPDITLFPVTIIFPTATRTPTPVNFGDFVWNDLDGDGRQDAGEPGLAGVTVQLWNSSKTMLIDSDVTDANGKYTVTSPGPGNYRIRALLPAAGDQFSPKNQAGGDDTEDSDINTGGTNFGFTDIYFIASNVISISSIDVGIRKFYTPTPTRTPTPVNIGNLIWADDGDGIQEVGEPGLANVTVRLWDANTNQLVDTKVTNANGNYTLVAPGPGNYRISVQLGIGSSFAPKDVGGDDQKDSDCNTDGVNISFTDVFNIASNVISTVIYDCGLQGPYSTATPTPPATSTPTPTPTPTETPEATPTPPAVIPEFELYAPVVLK
jgi:hypothetical protein